MIIPFIKNINFFELVKFMSLQKKSILPKEYIQVEYLESSGTQYINAIRNFDNRIRVYIDFAIDEYIHDTWICGVYNSAYGELYGLGMLNNQLYKHHPDVEYNPDVLQIGTIIAGSCFCDNYNSLYLFARSQAFTEEPSGCFKGKIYHAKVIQWDDKTTIRDMYPCIRKSDNKPGMYDIITNQFFTNSGTGEFETPIQGYLFGKPPFTFNSNGNPLVDYTISGNAIQSDTPTPETPVIPQGTGERTGNLAPPLTEWVDGYIATNGYIAVSSNINIEKASDYIPIKGGVPYTFSRDNGFPRGSGGAWRAIGWYDINKAFISRDAYNTENSLSAEAPQNAAYCRLSYRTYGETTNTTFNKGSTALPYEPYGYKIPISSANTTTPVYLGEVETTRKVKKLVLDGTETVAGSAVTGGWIITSLPVSINNTTGLQTSYCSHYVAKNNGAMPNLSQGEMCISTQYNNRINFVTTFATAEDFKSYLAAQYTAGTPVTVWYVLATEETGIVNEPLMKIGDYADTVSKAQAGVEIPTINGSNTLTVDTTLQPSEVSIVYKK